MMTPTEFLAEMIKISQDDDPESAHLAADNLMCEVLEELGYGEGVEIFYNMETWYS